MLAGYFHPAMAKNIAIAKVKSWRQLVELDNPDQRFADVFGKKPQIAWTKEEDGYLREIASFCIQQWPGEKPVESTARLVRGAFRHGTKAFQILKFWLKHGGKKISLRRYVMLAGGQEHPDRRQDFLKEVASTMEECESDD